HEPDDDGNGFYGDQLFDLKNDPNELEPIENETEKARLTEAMKVLMKESEAPSELYERMGL
ncbi:MAG: sulfatase, partial [Firmicutes bacterium]|nr:sulfatase [Bacillota bacterium]